MEQTRRGDDCGAALPSLMSVLAWNCRGLGSTSTVQLLTDEVKSKNPALVFLVETKASPSRIKGLQRKLQLSQGITVPCDGRSGGLAMLWREGVDVRFKSWSHSHIDVVVYGVGGTMPWRASGFYGNPDVRKRYESWELLCSLKNQCDMPWIVFGDFNEITHPEEKLGWLDRDANQMRSFRECLSKCGLVDLGFVGQRFTWCNGRFGEQRTLIRLDRMVANGKWVEKFPDAQVHHFSMSASDHCMLALYLTKKKRTKPTKRRFVFEAMWARDERRREVIERAWDPLRDSCEFSIGGRI
ncbi:uncharacterized protein LOC112033913 [Quercus suber]|uniref:uncharacterized protein LOC112033913 n=1 Tax=Quercus suber TaxID=58331 RepID=UPI000CE2743D|nr:uncharacterized protein LOC112033913 [Quercus suber]POE97941.1 hypothetical protein CFP56_27324 [Quercus suber]